MPAVYGAEASTVVSALTAALTTTATECKDAIAAVLPVALPVMGAIVVVGIGIKIFKKVTGKQSGAGEINFAKKQRGLPTGSGRSLFFDRQKEKKGEKREKKKNEAANSNPAGSNNDHAGYS